MKTAEDRIFQAEGRPPRIAELADCLDLDERGVAELLRGRGTMRYVSIDEKRRDDDPRPGRIDVNRLRPQGTGLSMEMRTRLSVAIEQLTEIQQQVIQGLFYEGKTQTEVGEEIGVSQRQVSRVKQRTLDEMRTRLLEEKDDAS